jgi:hypothetical protein
MYASWLPKPVGSLLLLIVVDSLQIGHSMSSRSAAEGFSVIIFNNSGK